jgi:carbonic anhydrase
MAVQNHDHSHAALPVTQAEQAAMTPESVLADLKAGIIRYVSGTPEAPNISGRIEAASLGQYPKAYVLSCVDSRVPVETIFDQSIGDIFVGRVAGNVENEDQLGSMEFAAAVAGIKLIVVMGHESCGAVKGACDSVELGNLTMLLEKIAPSVNAVEGHEDRSSKNKAFVDDVILANVNRTVGDLSSRSPVLAALVEKGQIGIVGAVYSLEDGSVSFQ